MAGLETLDGRARGLNGPRHGACTMQCRQQHCGGVGMAR